MVRIGVIVPSVNTVVEPWFARACHRNPAERFPSAGAAIEALAAVLGGDAMMARRYFRPDTIESPREPVLRRETLAADAAAVLRVVRDRFGVSWQVMAGRRSRGAATIVPSRPLTPSCQSVHHEPALCLAASNH